MPFGLSANSVGLDGRSTNWRRILYIGIPLTTLLAVACAAWLVVRSLAPLTTQAIYNGAYEYSFLFYKKSETVNLAAGSGLQYANKALVIAKPTGDDIVTACNKVGPKWKDAFTVRIEGVQRPVCQLNDNVFLVLFPHGRANHLFEITYTAPRAADTAEVQRIMQSLQVSLQ